jgi:hypothetical protein
VRDSEDEDDGDGVETNFGGGLTAGHDDEEEGEGDAGVTGGGLKVSDIDAFWLQRSLSKFYPDAHLSQKYAEVCAGIASRSSSFSFSVFPPPSPPPAHSTPHSCPVVNVV